MKHKLCWIFFLIAVASIFRVDARSEEKSPSEAISVVFPLGAGPYSLLDEEGELRGIAVDLWRLWSRKTGIEVNFVPAPWSEGIKMVAEGSADVHAYYATLGKPLLEFATPIFSGAGYLFWRKSINSASTQDDFRDFRIGLIEGGAAEEYFRKHPSGASLAVYPHFPAMMDALEKLEIAVFAGPLGTSIWHLKQRCLGKGIRVRHRETDLQSYRPCRSQKRKPPSCRNRQNRDGKNMSVDNILRLGLEEAVRLTGSRIGFFHLVNPDQKTIHLKAWSSGTRKYCSVEEPSTQAAKYASKANTGKAASLRFVCPNRRESREADFQARFRRTKEQLKIFSVDTAASM